MSDSEGYGDLEARLRVELRRRILPLPTPPHLRREIERMADEAVVGAGSKPRAWRLRVGLPRGLVAAAAILAIAATTMAWFGSRRTSGPAAPSPSGTHSRGPSAPSSGNEFATDADIYWGAAPNGVGFVYVEGEGLRITADHGATWSEDHRVPARVGDGHNPDLTSLEFLDAKHGWMTSILPAAGGERLVAYRTVDGGSTWQEATVASLPSGTSSPSASGGLSLWAAVHFRDTHHGQFFVQQLASDVVAHTTGESGCWRYASDDGGASWTGPESGSCVDVPAHVVWVDNLLGWGYPDTSSSGNVWLTQDGGVTWRTAALPATEGAVTTRAVAKGSGALTLVAMPDTYEGVLSLRVFRSADGGASWSYQHDVAMPGASTLEGFSMLSPEHWIAVDEVPQRGSSDSLEPGLQARTRVVETLDGGRTWTVLNEAAPWNPDALYWWDDTHGMTVASDPSCSNVPCSPRQKVFLTGDGGRTWQVATH